MSKYSYHKTNFENDNTKLFNTLYNNVLKQLNRKLSDNEKTQIENFISKIDPDLLQKNKENTIKLMSKTLINEFKLYDCKNLNNDYDDSQQILKNTIGTTSESSSSHGIYESPAYLAKLSEDKKKRIYDENLGKEKRKSEKKIIEESDQEIITQLENNNNQSIKSRGQSIKNDNKTILDTDPKAIARIINPKSQYKKAYCLLDTRYRSEVGTNNLNNSISKFTWDFNLNSQPSDNNSSVNVIGNMRDIISLRIYPFRIPYTKLLDNKYKRVSVLIDEFTSQAFVAHEQRKFHFILESDIDSDFINLSTDKFNDGYFYFEKPIVSLETISLTFANPLEQISFNFDRCHYTVDNFSIAPLTKITTYAYNNIDIIPNNLQSGDMVYFSGYKTGDINSNLQKSRNIDDSLQKIINNKEGHIINVIDKCNFSINVDTSLIQNPLDSVFSNVYFGSSRIFIPIEIEYIQPNAS